MLSLELHCVMDLLILGGTHFVGRHMTRTALDRGHTVTLFNRGKTNPELFPDAEHLRGDRDGDMSALEGRAWDAVLDMSGYLPRIVRNSAELIRAEHYTFVSSISVYPDDVPLHADESAEVIQLDDPTTETIEGETYGGLKVLCEEVVKEVKDAALILRPGLVVGPFDYTDRFVYWSHRVDEGGEVLAPEGPGVPIQFIDARDFADFAISSAESRRTGTYNVVSNADHFTMGELLETCKRVSESDATFTWVAEDFLLEQGVRRFSWDLPLWIKEEDRNFLRVSSEKALGQGLEIRPLELTVRDTLGWDKTRPEGEFTRVVSREREKKILEEWRKKKQ